MSRARFIFLSISSLPSILPPSLLVSLLIPSFLPSPPPCLTSLGHSFLPPSLPSFLSLLPALAHGAATRPPKKKLDSPTKQNHLRKESGTRCKGGTHFGRACTIVGKERQQADTQQLCKQPYRWAFSCGYYHTLSTRFTLRLVQRITCMLISFL